MKIGVLEITFRASWVHSLKEKHMIVKSLLSKLKNQFNVSVSETTNQEKHQLITIGVAALSHNTAQADSILDHVVCFLETHTEAEMIEIQREIL